MRTIKLYGDLAKKFGAVFRMDVSCPADALVALSCQLNGFEKYIIESERNGVGYVIKVDESEITNKKELYLNGGSIFNLVPVIGGSGGETRFLIGAALLGGVILASGGLAAFAAAELTVLGTFAVNTGVALALGGAVEILTRGSIPSSSPFERPENRPSYSFNGPVNTSAQGQPVPICYGRMIVGSSIISAAVKTESLMAGYYYQDVEHYVDVEAKKTQDNFSEPVPKFHRKEQIAFKTIEVVVRTPTTFIPGKGGGGWRYTESIETVDVWTFRLYYYKQELVLRPL